MRVQVNYTTFLRDKDWLDFSLQSFRKYASGFSGVTIVVPDRDIAHFIHFEEKFSTPTCPVLVKNFLEFPQKGFVHHLGMKCYADVFQPSATHILHMDPDCLFSAPVKPEDYFVDGKPVLLCEPYEAIRQVQHWGRFNWKGVTEMALKFPVTHEFMCRHPAVHKIETYRALRDHMEAVHPTPFLDFVLKQQNKFPQGFGEFNTLGAFVWEKMRSEYHFIDRGFEGEKNDPPSKVTQMWSYTGTESNMAKIKEILK
jgi:hypothetical protein